MGEEKEMSARYQRHAHVQNKKNYSTFDFWVAKLALGTPDRHETGIMLGVISVIMIGLWAASIAYTLVH